MDENQTETIPEFKPSPFGSSGGTLGDTAEKELPLTANPAAGEGSDDAQDEDTED